MDSTEQAKRRGPVPKTIEERLYCKIDRTGDGGCWLWTGATSRGVPWFHAAPGKARAVARLVWEIERGSLDPKERILKDCPTQLCISPWHHRKDDVYGRTIDDVWGLIAEPDENGCRLWLGPRENEYPRMHVAGKVVLPYQIIYEAKIGPLRRHQPITMTCGKRLCLEATHMRIGNASKPRNLPPIVRTEKKCSQCGATKRIEEFRKNPKSRDGHIACCTECHRARLRASNQRTALQRKERYLLKEFGIGLERYDAMLRSQGGGCAICGRHEEGRSLAIDHNHASGQVRGLLCSRCNLTLGWMEDNAVLLENAAGYLREHELIARTKSA